MSNETNALKKEGFGFFRLALYAFIGLGLEIVLGLLIEENIYGKSLKNFSTQESILHWILTCIIWSVVSYALIKIANKKYQFSLFSFNSSMKLQNYMICLAIFTISIIISILDWHGIKIQKEFLYNGWLKFIFQYIYYLCETVLVVLIIAFSQKAGEIWFKKEKIPWGGIFVGLSWGLVHILTKSSLSMGLIACLGGILYGIAYLACNKNLRFAFPLIFLMFVL